MRPSEATSSHHIKAIRDLFRVLDILIHNGQITSDIGWSHGTGKNIMVRKKQSQRYSSEWHYNNARGIKNS